VQRAVAARADHEQVELARLRREASRRVALELVALDAGHRERGDGLLEHALPLGAHRDERLVIARDGERRKGRVGRLHDGDHAQRRPEGRGEPGGGAKGGVGLGACVEPDADTADLSAGVAVRRHAHRAGRAVQEALPHGAGQHPPEPAAMGGADYDQGRVLALGQVVQAARVGGRSTARVSATSPTTAVASTSRRSASARRNESTAPWRELTRSGPYRVQDIRREEALVLLQEPPSGGLTSWSFLLRPARTAAQTARAGPRVGVAGARRPRRVPRRAVPARARVLPHGPRDAERHQTAGGEAIGATSATLLSWLSTFGARSSRMFPRRRRGTVAP
jgi:hypothetical protein